MNRPLEEAEQYIKKLEDDWINTVELLNEITREEWEKYDFPIGLVKLIKLRLKKINISSLEL